jgi:RNA polymerase sigma factor (sigma-70 family)
MTPQVLAIAKSIRSHYPLPPSMEWGDVLQSAYIGYLAAIARYDPAQEATFSTYLEYKIRGAILDAYRKGRGWRDCTPVKPSFVALEKAADCADDGLALDEACAIAEEVQALRDVLTRLSERERVILHEYYWEGRPRCDISTSLNLSPARIGQIERQAIRKLREVLLDDL